MEVQRIELDNIVAFKRIHITATGKRNLKNIREWMKEGIEKSTGIPVELPYPVVIHNVLDHYVKLKNIEVKPYKRG